MSDTTIKSTTTVENSKESVAPINIPFVDQNFDGIPDKLQSFLTRSDFRSNWQDQRMVIFFSLAGMGVLIAALVICILYMMITNRPLNGSLDGLVNTLLMTLPGMFFAVFGVYIGGKHLDISSFRTNSVSVISSLVNGVAPNK